VGNYPCENKVVFPPVCFIVQPLDYTQLSIYLWDHTMTTAIKNRLAGYDKVRAPLPIWQNRIARCSGKRWLAVARTTGVGGLNTCARRFETGRRSVMLTLKSLLNVTHAVVSSAHTARSPWTSIRGCLRRPGATAPPIITCASQSSQAVGLYRGFLGQLSLGDCPAFETWIGLREHLRGQVPQA
jgi:hypothetical protein